jgi:hypothetical protein
MPYQPLDTPFLIQRFCIMCRAFFPDCELDIPGDGTVTATFGTLGYADMYPSVAPDRTREDPGDMLMLLYSGEVFTNEKLLWSGYDVEKFLDRLKQFSTTRKRLRSKPSGGNARTDWPVYDARRNANLR